MYSRLYGNYAGLGNSDEISTPTTGVSSSTTQQSGGSIARPGSTGSRAWDIDQILFDSHGNFVEGRLATDRPHVVKNVRLLHHQVESGDRRLLLRRQRYSDEHRGQSGSARPAVRGRPRRTWAALRS